MENPESYPIIGSSHEGAQDMFDLEREVPAEELEHVSQKRNERGIFEDAEKRFEAALAQAGYEHVLTLPNGITYPTVDEWIHHRINHDRGTKFYPAFIKKEGQIYFCKVHINNNPRYVEALHHEAEVLKMLPGGVNAPKCLGFEPGNEQTTAMLITEAIPFSEATIKNVADWKPEDVEDISRQIKTLESMPLEDPKKGIEPDVNRVQQLLLDAGETVDTTLYPQIAEIINSYKDHGKSVRVHGDMTTKNVLIGDKKSYLVDWELSEESFIGRDAAKVWSGLQDNPEVQDAFLKSYVAQDTDRLMSVAFGIVYENLVHLAWRNQEIILKSKQEEHKNLDREIQALNNTIRKIITILH